MRAFFYILQKCANSTTITYPDEPLRINTKLGLDKPAKYDFMKVCYVYNIVCKIYNEFTLQQQKTKPKFQKQKSNKQFAWAKLKVFSQILYNDNNQGYNQVYNDNNQCNNDNKSKSNPSFFLNIYKYKLLGTFSKAQRTYKAFARLAHIYKLKKYKTVVTEDLSMNPLDPKHPSTFILCQNNSNYLFNINDIVKIIENAITHAPSFFQDPIEPKNPYNNEKFNLSTLYNIYFKLKALPRLMPTLLHLFFLENFDIDEFILNNEPLLRETAIRKYIHNSPDDILYKSITKMLMTNYYTRKLTIHKEFPLKTLTDIFKPFLYYFYIINYDIQGTEKIDNYKRVLYIKLKKFYEYNKAFGRKMYNSTIQNKLLKRLNLPIIPQTYFSTRHLSFHNISITNEEISDVHILFYAMQEEDDELSETDDDDDEEEEEEDETVLSGAESSEDDELADISIS